MRFLKVLKPGFLTSIQDLGRKGALGIGVSEAGAADQYSLRLGNLLVGNPQGAAALELTLLGGRFEFLSDGIIAVTGSDFSATLDGQPAAMWQSFSVRSGQVLSFGATKMGARCYLIAAGGFQVDQVMGSSSTHLLTRIGGLDGRSLQEGDVLHIQRPLKTHEHFIHRRVAEIAVPTYNQTNRLRVILGPEDDYFTTDAVETFLSSAYEVTESSDRVGLRLEGPSLKHSRGADILSEGVTAGSIQVPANGMPIILFLEHPTAGGYPKIATVISADIHRLGQAKPRDTVCFEAITMEEAVKLLEAQEKLISTESLSPV